MNNVSCKICGSEAKLSFQKNNYDFHKCKNCDLIFVHPQPNDLDIFYDKSYYKSDVSNKDFFGYADYEKDKEPMKSNFVDILEYMKDKVPSQSVFDIGAATGYFLDIAKSKNWATYGSEISNYSYNLSRVKGHKMVLGGLEKYDDTLQFGMVTMWDVLEHLKELNLYLKGVNRILKDEGWVLINTINAKSLWAKLWGKNWNMIIPPEHLFYFSKKNLNKLLEDNGFQIVEYRKMFKKFSLSYIFKVLYNWQKIKVFKKLSIIFDNKFWRKFKIPIYLGDNIFILAKKIKDV